MRIALVEDAALLRDSLAAGMGRCGWSVASAADGDEGWWLLQDGGFDCMVLDIMLPGPSGLELLRRVRERGDGTPVLLLTARDAIEDRVEGLRRGADDYLTKPFAISELLARIEALVRRRHGHPDALVTIGALVVDLSAHRASVAGTELRLPRRELALLELLALHHGQIVSKTMIEAHLHDPEADLQSNTVEAAVCLLRAKLRGSKAEGLLQTRRGLGYCLAES